MTKRMWIAAMAWTLAGTPSSQSQPLVVFHPEDAKSHSITQRVVWSAEPGVRYELQSSPQLSGWITVPGFPAPATALAQQHTVNLTNANPRHFRVRLVDEQPPVVTDQFPAADAFGVRRFSPVSVVLDDVSGINPASLRFTVGSVGPLALPSSNLTWASNTLTYASADVPLGAWGATVTATLVVSDPLGHTTNHTWSFRLEPEPIVASNIFVFGSPSAGRAGQQVSGPAAFLAARSPSTPIKANGSGTSWSITSVSSNQVVITYSGGPAPAFTPGQLICNLAPTREDHIFYRRVLSVHDNAAGTLTLTTTDIPLTDFVIQGGSSFSPESAVFEVDTNGALRRALSGTLNFPAMGFDFSGSSFGLRNDGYEATIRSVTYSLGSDPLWMEVAMPEYSWWLTPRIQAALELDLGGMKSFEAFVQGVVAVRAVLDADVTLAGVRAEIPLFDLPEASEPRSVVYLGQIGVVPVFATLGFDVSLRAEAQAAAALNFDATYRQEHSAVFGLSYERGTGTEWIRSFHSSAADLRGEASLTGELSFHLKLDPRIEFLVYGLAGVKAAIEPSAGVVTTVPLLGGVYDGKLEADVDLVLGSAGPAFEAIPFEEQLKFKIWHGEYPLTPQTLVFTTQPRSQTAEAGDAVAFSCVVDSPSPPSFQWYHKDLLVPGETNRSLFLPRVNEGHAGVFRVRATAGPLSADSDLATLTIRAVTPETLDSDGDGIPDIVETGTGFWSSDTDRGTDPFNWDSDGDGLGDDAESNTGDYASPEDTGTNPNEADSDGDGVNDAREIELGTDPSTPAAPSGVVEIPAGSVSIGDTFNEGDPDERPVHSAQVAAFKIDAYEVTKATWDEVYAWATTRGYTFDNEGYGKAVNHPVQSVNWYDAVKWCNARSEKEGRTPAYYTAASRTPADIYRTGRIDVSNDWVRWDSGYRLPTEAEWEKAARGGAAGQRFPWSGNANIQHARANYFSSTLFPYDNSPTPDYHPTYFVAPTPYTAPVGSFAANGYGLYDMAGNVREWCWDWFSTNSYASAPGTDPRGPVTGEDRVLRGGSWYEYAEACRVAARYPSLPGGTTDDYGFRVVVPGGPPAPSADLAMAVDGNRDDILDFAEPGDTNYLFWVNDDIDVISGNEEDDAASGTPNGNDTVITCRRDLEDFARLHLRVAGATASMTGVSYGLSFEGVTSGSPSINLFEAVDSSMNYLKNLSVSGQQITKSRLLEITTTPQQLPNAYVRGGGQRSAFLFEGKTAGKGRLVLAVKQGATELGRAAVNLDLRPITAFYEKYVATITTDDNVTPTSTQVGAPTYVPQNSEYLLHVHGWNMEDTDKDRWTETLFKRMWWQRYKGRVGSFQWPTLGLLYYDRSEFRAWRSAEALSHRIGALDAAYPGQVRVLAHSMGNVVAGEALQQAPAGVVHTYVAMQAALPAHCYDAAIANYWSGFTTPNVYGFYTSGQAPSLPYLAGNSARAGSMAQYFNRLDFALGAWEFNNETKPDLNYHYADGDSNLNTYEPSAGDRFYYDSLLPLDERDMTFPDNRYEIFARCAESRSRALGREGAVAGFAATRNLQVWGYDGAHYSHSRQFRSNVVAEWPFWNAVVLDCNLSQ